MLLVSCDEALNTKRNQVQRALIVWIGVVQEKEDQNIKLSINDKTSKNQLEAG